MKPILEHLDTLEAWLTERGFPAYRAKQIKSWIYQRRAIDFASMSDLPKALREQLAAEFVVLTSIVKHRSVSVDGTEKLLLEVEGQGKIECVLLRDGLRRTVCISSQVGCAMGCVFCASGLDGVDRNLKYSEIVEELLHLQRLLPPDERLSHIVVMGMGEPLTNLDNVLKALEIASDDNGLGISQRRITISTVGLPPAIRRLAKENPRYHLAVSLHAPTDQLRNQIVPVNDKIGVRAVMEAADDYFEASGRRLTFEYVLLADINDQPQHARELCRLLGNRTALLNVIPYNPVAGLPYRTPTPAAIREFRNILMQGGINVKFRQRKGDDINAACGQLRRSKANPEGLVQIEATS